MNELSPPFSLADTSSQLGFREVKLSPYRITETLLGTVYEFWRGNPKGDGPKEMAMIVFNRNKTVFTLQYYPLDSKDLQIVQNLPISKLHEAAENLKSAGFI
jgi:hypothetical protein